MPGNRRQKPSKAFLILGLCAVVAAVAVGLGVLLKEKTVPTRQLESPASKEVVAKRMPQDAPGESRHPIPGTPETPAADPKKSQEKLPQQPVVDYGGLKEDKNLQALMEKRKESYGFEKGVDLIVKPDESVKVGAEVVPMKDILDKIRLKSGEVVEKDLAGGEEKAARKLREELAAELDRVEKRYLELGKLIENLDPQADPKTRENYLREREELGAIVSAYKNYKETDRRIDEKKSVLHSLNRPEKSTKDAPAPSAAADKRAGIEAGVSLPAPVGTAQDAAPVGKKAASMQPSPAQPAREERSGERKTLKEGPRRVTVTELKKEIEKEINTLQLQKGDIENELKILMKKEKRPEAYGIYVVQPKDNIWNIHFKFLKDYFDHRGKGLADQSDEPDPVGRSSGVGKILKFSEKMVYIYNIRDRELASDIHLIQPLSKIVVFNMGKVFELLEGVDYNDLDQIRFDGENIWLPARG